MCEWSSWPFFMSLVSCEKNLPLFNLRNFKCNTRNKNKRTVMALKSTLPIGIYAGMWSVAWVWFDFIHLPLPPFYTRRPNLVSVSISSILSYVTSTHFAMRNMKVSIVKTDILDTHEKKWEILYLASWNTLMGSCYILIQKSGDTSRSHLSASTSHLFQISPTLTIWGLLEQLLAEIEG